MFAKAGCRNTVIAGPVAVIAGYWNTVIAGSVAVIAGYWNTVIAGLTRNLIPRGR